MPRENLTQPVPLETDSWQTITEPTLEGVSLSPVVRDRRVWYPSAMNMEYRLQNITTQRLRDQLDYTYNMTGRNAQTNSVLADPGAYGPSERSVPITPRFTKGDLVYYDRKSDGVRRYGIVDRVENNNVWANWDDKRTPTCRYVGYTNINGVHLVKPKIPVQEFKELKEFKAKDYTNMAFGARVEDMPFQANGKTYKSTWRICLRKGRIIRGTSYPSGDDKDWIDFKFKSQKLAKACADELNEKYWKDYKDNLENKDGFDKASEMVETIKEYL